MAYNTTKAEKDDAVLRDTRNKIEREAIIGFAIIKRYFKPISKDSFSHYSKFGVFPILQPYRDALEKILNQQYEGTAQLFIRQVRDSLGEPENAEEINTQVNESSSLKQTVDIFMSLGSIMKTTEKDMARSIRDVIEAAAILGVVLSNRKIARKAKKKFDSLSSGRVDGISMTQTQQAAEGAKNTELSTLLRNSAVFTIANVSMGRTTVKKTWMTVMDSRVRMAHALAEKQTVAFDKPYQVGGQLLMYPGDTSLGATMNNIVNCRCASIKTITRDS